MNNSVKFSCVLDTTDAACALSMEIWLDDQQIFHSSHITGTTFFQHDVCDDESNHQLRFVMTGKTVAHTQIDANGQIVSDARLLIKDLAFDEIKLGLVFSQLSTYTHDFNGTGSATQEKFYQEMGCNGTVSFQFSTPVYLWLLEHM